MDWSKYTVQTINSVDYYLLQNISDTLCLAIKVDDSVLDFITPVIIKAQLPTGV